MKRVLSKCIDIIDNYSKTVWQIINTETGRKNEISNSPENLTADQMNEFFINNMNSTLENFSGTDPIRLLEKKYNINNSMFFRPLTSDDTGIITINKLKNGRTDDIKVVNMFFIKSGALYISDPLTDIINAWPY
ncbi:hypothetical protein JTB14_003542 [Gonioctena quinquepunctata]|nr:hypothetical protein JTB14_003542 [Gonioctena quinquepunctata]